MIESFNSFSLATVNAIAAKLMDHTVFSISIDLAKGICILVLVAYYIRKYFSAYNDPQRGKIGPYDIVRPLLYISLLVAYTEIFNAMEKVAVSFDNLIVSSINPVPKAQGPQLEEKPDEDTVAQPGPLEKMSTDISSVIDTITNPEKIILKALDFLSTLISSIVFIVALIARAAGLFILKFLGPFAIVASIFDAYKTYFFNWLKVYALVYASVFVFFVINLFCDTFQSELWAMKSSNTVSLDSSLASSLFMESTFTIILIAVTVCKVILYSKSITLMKSAFSSSS